MKLPSDVKPRKLIQALLRAGFLETNRVGSHIHLHHPDCRRTQVSVHNRPIARGTLSAIFNQTELSRQELLGFLRKKI